MEWETKESPITGGVPRYGPGGVLGTDSVTVASVTVASDRTFSSALWASCKPITTSDAGRARPGSMQAVTLRHPVLEGGCKADPSPPINIW